MALSKNEVMDMVQGFLNTCSKKHDIKRAYIFGSFAKGMARDYSDVDLAVVLGTLRSSEDSIFNEDFEIFHEAQQYNSLLEVVCFLEDAFDRDSGALIKRIKKEGIMVM
jgi:predicted nucleotidyltransferase